MPGIGNLILFFQIPLLQGYALGESMGCSLPGKPQITRSYALLHTISYGQEQILHQLFLLQRIGVQSSQLLNQDSIILSVLIAGQ